MDLRATIYKNHRKEIDGMLSTIDAVLGSSTRDQHLNTAGDKKFFSFNFNKFPSQKFVLPYLKEEILKRGGYDNVTWEFSDKFNAIYFYVYPK